MNKYIKAIICFILFNIQIYASENDIYFYQLTPRDGLSQMSILSIYQDEFGAMWFGTTEGLDRYNGKSIETFKPSENKNISNNTIQYITGDQSGTLYFTTGNDLAKFDINTLQFSWIASDIRTIKYAFNELWVAKKDSILLYDAQKDKFRLHTTLNNHRISAILPTDSLNMWIGTNNGLFKFNKKSSKLESVIAGINVSYLFLDSKQNLWVATKSEGIYVINKDDVTQSKIYNTQTNALSDNQIRSIAEDNLGNIWVATFYGLNKFDPSTQIWQQFIHDNTQPYSISHSSIFALYNDKQGTMWIGTYFGGVNYFNAETNTFNFYDSSLLNTNPVSFPYVGNMIEDKHGNLWICTEGGQLNCLNLETRKITKYRLRDDDKPTERYNQKTIWYDADADVLYIGIHNGGLSILDLKTKTTKFIDNFYPIDTPKSRSSNTINHIEYYNGELILMTSIGLIKMDLQTHTFKPFSNNPKINDLLEKAKRLTFHIDSKNRLWLVTDGIAYIDLNTNKIVLFEHNESDLESIGKCEINYIYESKNGNIYFSTLGSGIFRYNESTNNFQNFTAQKNGLISDFCYYISETPSGNLILLHNKGISFINPNNEENRIFHTSPNFPIIGFNTGNSVYVTKKNEIFIGGVNGLISFYEQNINKKNNDYSIYFDKLYINNNVVKPGDNNSVLDKILPLSKQIDLGYNQNNFGIEFAISSYIQTITHNYEYKLIGFDKEWKPAQTNTISYTNLNPGKYTLIVREIGNPEIMNELVIYIQSPYYRSTVAYIIYILLIILLIYAIVRFFKWRTKLEESLKFEHIEKERIKDLNQMKLRFFTNVSHEFRTPLTLIISYVDSLLIKHDLPQTIRNRVEKISRNTNHLLNLINELLDFRKQEQGYTKLKVRKIELVDYITDIYNVFKDYASTKNINFKFNTQINDISVYVDPEYFRKAIYNILSNAFKYTPKGGSISINIKQLNNNSVTVEIKDTGIGISDEYLDKIFDRFYQVQHRSSEVNYGTGTGIGLALTKEIINGHKGEISVRSTVNEGSTFSITLKLGSEHFSKEELVNENEYNSQKEDLILFTNLESESENSEISNNLLEDSNKTKPTLLIADDNVAIIEVLSEAFSANYNILKAYNGLEGYEIAKNEDVDIIISDNIMPEMSGKELCYKIKNNVLISHIPFVLLTAETSDSQIAEGYMFGADAYITKPFNTKIVISICNNLLRNRQLIYRKFREESTETNNYQLDENNDLVDRAIKIIKNNLSNPDFDMNKLGVELGYGRSKLYVKIKEATGMTPNELTLNVKLKEAVFQLEHYHQKNISQIAFELGFSSTKYFSKCFKSFYGITPQDWRKNNS